MQDKPRVPGARRERHQGGQDPGTHCCLVSTLAPRPSPRLSHVPVQGADPHVSLPPGIRRWHAFNPAIRADWSCHAIQARDGRWILFDPFDGPSGLGWESQSDGVVGAIIATNGNHERAATAWMSHVPVPAWASPDAGLPCAPWQPLVPGLPWLDDWDIADLRGGGPGEVAIRVPALDLVVFGDAVINLPGRALEFLPDKYCTSPSALREGVARLLRRPFSRALLAHGEPLVTDASARIAALLR